MLTSKILHDWLPVMHMLSHITGNSQCPGCTCNNETLDHLFHCPNHLMLSTRMSIVNTMRKKGMRRGIPRAFLDALSSLLSDHFNDTTSSLPAHSSLREASLSQRTLGTSMLLRGYLVRAWSTALTDLGVENPPRMMTWVLRFIWFECTDLLWRERNDILHRSKNNTTQLDELRLETRLRWFLDNHTTIA